MVTATSAEVRRAFLEYFRERGHAAFPSAPLIPQNDPTLLFTNAGMVPFKDVFTGAAPAPVAPGASPPALPRATSSQKVIRISGKHNDLENVGVTARHHTFFEMLGNFSFGDYFKEGAIELAWGLLRGQLDLDASRMAITVFGGADGVAADDEAREIWRRVSGFPEERIVGLGMKDNFWQMGDTGPCGPCTEIHYWNGEGAADMGKLLEEPTPDGKGWMEIWNLVFMQFERSVGPGGEATLAPLPKPCVDTGAGLERLSSVLQGVTSNYETDLLRALVERASEVSGKRYRGSQADDDVSMRVIADHARTTAFLIAEGVFPDRAGREYVLRRVMRRAIRHGHRLGIRAPFLHEVALEVVRLMGSDYPELEARRELIESVTLQEEVRFRETIDRGLEMIDKNTVWRKDGERAVMPGAVAFKLYDTFGFPLDLTQVIGGERGFEVDTAEFERSMEEQRARSEGSRVGDAAVEGVWREVLEAVRASGAEGVKFVGYEREEGTARVVALVHAGARVERIEAGQEAVVVTDLTPFYGEAGGQVGDRGLLTGPKANPDAVRFEVRDTQKPLAGVIAHHGVVAAGSLSVGDTVSLEVDHALRTATRRNHSATHLLHWALRTVLGEQATQKGSLVGPERLRFDFSHGKALAADEITRIEDLVNEKILTAAPVLTEVMPIDLARQRGAVAIFEEKYGDVVRVLTMTPDSVELCGGTHARSLGEIGSFRIKSEGGLAAGVRRIEAVTGMNTLRWARQIEQIWIGGARALGADRDHLVEQAEKVVAERRHLEKEVADLKRQLAMGSSGGGGMDAMLAGARDLPGGGGKALSVKAPVSDAATLRELAEKLRDRLGEGVVLVGAAGKDKAMLVLVVSKGLTGRFPAGPLIKGVAEVLGGSGGGRPDMAQAGGPEIGKLDEALAGFYAKLG